MNRLIYLEMVDDILNGDADECSSYHCLITSIKGGLLAAVKYLFRIGELS